MPGPAGLREGTRRRAGGNRRRVSRGEVDCTIAGDEDLLAAGHEDVLFASTWSVCAWMVCGIRGWAYQRASISIEDGPVTRWTARRQGTGGGRHAVQKEGKIGRRHHAIVDGCPWGAGSDLEGEDTGGSVLCCCQCSEEGE